jgi:signal transduction histidine kinase
MTVFLISPAYFLFYRPLKNHWNHVLQSEKEIRFLGQKLLSSTDETRRDLARDLHDECGGLLSAAQMKMEALKHQIPPDSAQSREQADQIIGILAQLGQSLRGIFTRLRPITLEQFGLVHALDRLTKEYAAKWPELKIDFQADPLSIPLPPETEIALFHICQEALNNSAKHARAGKIKIRLAREGRCVVLSIEDDGKGMTQEQTGNGIQEGGFGLIGMRERSVNLGGAFELFSSPGAGVLVRASLPLAPAGKDME